MLLRCVLAATIWALVLAKPKPSPKCGYEACPTGKPGMLNVHLVPHSHDDVGWLKTTDQYYYGSRTDIQRAGVQYIFDSVIQELLHDPAKRFIWVETAFIWKWWKEQGDHLRHQVKTLVNSGRLEIIGGGWSMNDEAVTHYQSTIDQFTWGFRKLNDTFGSCGRPRIGWQIDPFGHSRETASLMANLGFDGLFIGRLDYQDKELRLNSKTPEFVWQASQNLGNSSWLFTHVLYHNYSPPPGFCFDLLCDDEPFIDNIKSPDFNVDKKVEQFIKFVKKQAESYSTNNIILTMGEDFNYQDAHMYFLNMDKLIRYVNEASLLHNDTVNVFYSTPSCYLKAVHEANLTWTSKQDDFFPYPSDQNSYWTGYFTSRPSLKYFERKGNNFLQVCKQLYALADLGPADWADLNAMREAMGVMQHHDAITGTSKQNVTFEYARSLSVAFAECHNTAETALNKLMKKNASAGPPINMEPCMLLNVSQCETSEKSDSFVVTVYNPLAHKISHYVRLPVSTANYTVLDPQGKEVQTQLVPIPEAVLNIPGRFSDAKHELVFRAANIDPLGFKTYFIKKSGKIVLTEPVTGPERFNLETEDVRIKVDEETGRIKAMSIGKGKLNDVDQNFLYYEAAVGDNYEPKNRSSGAYIFRPSKQTPVPFGKTNTTTIKGPLVQELHQTFSSWVSQVVRIYKDDPSLELEWLVGPIPIEDGVGKEVISHFSTGWATNGYFYTDSNGREILERKRNYRPTWKVNISEPVAGNYYPVTSVIAIKSKDITFGVLPDRAQGGSSLKDGDIELMVHRRLLHDDAFGVGEALNETAFGKGMVARGRHMVVLGTSSNSPTAMAEQRRIAMSRLVMSPWLLMAPTKMTFEQWQQNYFTEFSGLKTSLPDNVHLLTLEPWKGYSFLLRLEHFLEKDEDPMLSKPATVRLSDMFSAFDVVEARETTLGGNQWYEESSRFDWDVDTNEILPPERNRRNEPPTSSNGFRVILQPMQIRTFIIRISPK